MTDRNVSIYTKVCDYPSDSPQKHSIPDCFRPPTTPELLAALSENPDVVCGECENGLEYPSPSFSESHPLPVPCPVCGGSGLNPKLMEAVAKAFYEADDTYPEKWEFQAEDVKDWYRDKATAALRAFLSGGWTDQ